MQKIVWEVQYAAPPLALRYCSKCQKKAKYTESQRFRVNAQGKYLDIWLIYKCTECQTTWNLPIYSRIHPQSIDSKLLNCFHANDEAIARQYAFNTGLLINNGAEVQLPDYEVAGPPIPQDTPVELQIKSGFPLPIKVSGILKKKLQLSQRELEKLVKDNQIKNMTIKELKKCRLNQGITFYLNHRS